jgi:hypothetical protein
MRVLAVIVIILGLASLVLGILFIPQASSAKQEVADSLTAPVTLDTLDATYKQIDGAVKQTPQTDPKYLTYFAQRTSLGLARSNVGTAKAVMVNGIVDIIVGAGLIVGGYVLLRKKAA